MGDQESEKLEVGAYATSLHQAVKENDIRSIRSLVEGGAKVQAPDKIGRTPLHWALVFGHEDAARVLIINTPKRALDARDGFGCTALHYGAATGRTQVARILIERGAAINALDSNKRTPLHLAAQNVNPDMVELLTSRGADKSLADVKGALPFDVATDWNSLSSIPCLRPDTTKLISDKVDTAEVFLDKKEVIVEIPTNKRKSFVAEKPPRQGPSLERLLGVWKAAEREAHRKKDAEVEAAQKATATLNTALKEWRKAELEVRILKAQISNISNLCNCKLVAGESAITEEGRTCGQQSCNKKPPEGGASTTSSARHQSLSVDVEFSATAEEQEHCSTDSQQSSNDLSWCTEWEVQGMEATTTQVLSPQERKSPKLLHKGEDAEPVWVQVPTFKQKFDILSSDVGLKTSNSFDTAHFLVMIGGLSEKLPFMSSLEVY
ncbi:unnamed protein product [Sphagnum troendelagicum]